jgi:hypothetical protein
MHQNSHNRKTRKRCTYFKRIKTTKILLISVTVLLFQSCSNTENVNDIKHEILNVILKDRLTLEKKNFIYVNREDTK